MKLTPKCSLHLGICAWDSSYLRLSQILTVGDYATSHGGEALEKSKIWWLDHKCYIDSSEGSLGTVEHDALIVRGISYYGMVVLNNTLMLLHKCGSKVGLLSYIDVFVWSYVVLVQLGFLSNMFIHRKIWLRLKDLSFFIPFIYHMTSSFIALYL